MELPRLCTSKLLWFIDEALVILDLLGSTEQQVYL